MKVKKYICGICKDKGINTNFTRHGLRYHMKHEHFILTSITNSKDVKGTGDRSRSLHKQSWWITEEM